MTGCHHRVMWITFFGYVRRGSYLRGVRSGSVERAGTIGQLKESEVGCPYPTHDRQERSPKVRPLIHINKFFLLRTPPYICIMYLKTPTSTLSVHSVRRIVSETISWCEKNVGTKRKRLPLTFKVTSVPFCNERAYGQYDPTTNKITISHSECQNVKMIIRVVLHEYCHFLQDMRSYSRVLREVGYNKHPMENEARVMETMYSICFKDIKNNL